MLFRYPNVARPLFRAVIGIALFVGSACHPTSPSLRPSPEPAAGADVSTQCPYGHATVRRAEVLYGLLFPSDNLRRSIDAREVVAGGCTIFEGESPAYLLVCKTCDFRMDPVTEVWTRESADPHTFDRSLAAPILSFPLADKPQGQSVEYAQHFQDGQLTTESVGYWTTEAKDVILSRVHGFVEKHESELVSGDPESRDPRWLVYELSIDGVPAELQISWVSPSDAHVSLDYPQKPLPELRNPSAAVKLDD